MIVDDQIVICGSANINDRSMRGSRDSEICAIIEDRHYVDTLMNGKAHKAGAFAYNLRRNLWQQHLGLADDELDLIKDPNHVSVFRDIWQGTSRHNTQILARVFPTSVLNPKEHKQQQHEGDHQQVGKNEFVTELTSPPDHMSVETVEPSSIPLQTQTKIDGQEGKDAAAALADNSSASPSSSPSMKGNISPSLIRRMSSPNGNRQDGPSNPEGSEYIGDMSPEAENLLNMLSNLRGFLNDYPLDLFVDEDLDFRLGRETFVPKNVFL